MIKINYPEDEKSFEDDYIKAINLTNDWNSFIQNIDSCVKRILDDNNIKSFKDILLLPFDKLLAIFKSFPKIEIEKDNNGNKIKSIYEVIFDYEKLQPNIAEFFMDNSKELNLKTCYFCNIDYINTFDNTFYETVLYILKHGNLNQLKTLNGIGKAKAKALLSYRKSTGSINFSDIQNIKTNNGRNIDLNKIKETIFEHNHFTLDHFLPKAKCPLLALSLYNFVPSCYACNSKFKGEEELLKTYLSPTSKAFSVNTDVKFKIYYEGDINKNNFNLELKYPRKISKYINVFKLQGRYAFHKGEAEELISKQEAYSDSRIDEIANILQIPSSQVKKDIFGKELFEGDVQEKSFTKLKRDIYVT